jgi:hypothetical protein
MVTGLNQLNLSELEAKMAIRFHTSQDCASGTCDVIFSELPKCKVIVPQLDVVNIDDLRRELRTLAA